MINRLRTVVPHKLFRGSAPSPNDVNWLKNELGIKKIVSLDELSGEKINRTCKILNINHLIIPIIPEISFLKRSLINFFKYDLKKLLLEDGPTYVHCAAGKDRTGLAVALVKCKYLGEKPENAIDEAKSLGFGLNIDPKITNVFEKLIRSCKSNKDKNNADIVSNEREYIGDNRDSFLDEGHQGSFSPYLGTTRQYPQDPVYNFINDQSPTRENYESYKSIKEHNKEDDKEDIIPLVGAYDDPATGFGPIENSGKFIYD